MLALAHRGREREGGEGDGGVADVVHPRQLGAAGAHDRRDGVADHREQDDTREQPAGTGQASHSASSMPSGARLTEPCRRWTSQRQNFNCSRVPTQSGMRARRRRSRIQTGPPLVATALCPPRKASGAGDCCRPPGQEGSRHRRRTGEVRRVDRPIMLGHLDSRRDVHSAERPVTGHTSLVRLVAMRKTSGAFPGVGRPPRNVVML